MVWNIQKSIYQQLNGDSGLMAQLSAIYDHVPDESQYPYVVIGDFRQNDASTQSTVAHRVRIELAVYSRSDGKKECLEIMDYIHTLLHQASLNTTGYHVVHTHITRGEVERLRDGLTYRGVLDIALLAEEV